MVSPHQHPHISLVREVWQSQRYQRAQFLGSQSDDTSSLIPTWFSPRTKTEDVTQTPRRRGSSGTPPQRLNADLAYQNIFFFSNIKCVIASEPIVIAVTLGARLNNLN